MYSKNLIQHVSELYKDVSLARTAIIGVQHILPSTLDMLKVFMKHGLKPQNIFLLGKCYSTNPKTYQAMIEKGINVCEGSFAFDPQRSFDDLFCERVEGLIDKALLTLDFEQLERVIVIDDGGILIRSIRRLPKSVTDKIVCIEQTSAGYHRIKDTKLVAPVINVARAKVKLQHETPSVASGITTQIKKRLPEKKSSVLIMGKGVIGQACSEMLEGRCEISFFDINPERSCYSHDELMNRLNDFDVILGVTGATSLGSEYHHLLKEGVMLVSGSSSDREFAAKELRKNMDKISHCHQDITVGGITLANCGFPVNFNNDFDNIDTSGFQLTRALLTTAVFQAYLCESKEPSLFDVDPQVQDALLQLHNC